MKIISGWSTVQYYDVPSFCVDFDKEHTLGLVIIFSENQSLRGRQKIFYMLPYLPGNRSHHGIHIMSAGVNKQQLLYSTYLSLSLALFLLPYLFQCHSLENSNPDWMHVKKIVNECRDFLIVQSVKKYFMFFA